MISPIRSRHRIHVLLSLGLLTTGPLLHADSTPGLDDLADSPSSAPQFFATTAVDYQSGKYGMEGTTRSGAMSLTVECYHRNWTIGVYLPYEYVDSPGGVTIIDGRPVPTLGASNLPQILDRLGLTPAQIRAATARQRQTLMEEANLPRQSNSGLGDVELSVDYDAYTHPESGWGVTLNGTVKFPTGSETDGLGTGETDYRFSATVFRSFSVFTPYLEVGYSILGRPADSDLRNYGFASIGTSYALGEATHLSATFSASQRPSESSGSSREVSLGVSHRLGDAWDLNAYVLAGLSDSAPDAGAGVSLRYSF